MPEVATAWITLAVSADNMQRDIRRELNKVDDGTAKTVGRKIGKQLEESVADGAKGGASQIRGTLSERLGTQVGSVVGKGIGAGIKLGVAGAASAAALAVGGIGVALTKGFDRLQAIDNARFKLLALGNDAQTVAKIMDSAQAAVKGTAFSLDQAAGTAASAVAAGVKPGQDLTKYLKEIGDLAAVSQKPLEDVGSIFNKIQTTNKVYLEDLQQLPDIPIFKWLQDEYGVTADKLSDMVSKGEVDSAHFQEAIDKNIGGAALKMGQSFSGAVDNMETSVARLGANFISAILGGDPTNALAGPTEAIGALTTKFDEVGAWVTAHRGEIHQFFSEAAEDAKAVWTQVQRIGEFLIDNEQLVKNVVVAFAAWKTIDGVSSLVSSLGGLTGVLRNDLPKAAEDGVGGINKAFALIAIPAIGEMANDQIQDWLQKNNPDLYKANNTNTPDQAGKQARDWFDRQVFTNPDAKPTPVPVTQLPQTGSQSSETPTVGGIPIPGLLPKKAAGGAIFGAGSGTSDSIPAWLSNGEHVWTADEVKKAGGQSGMYAMRAMVRRFAGGGAVTLDAVKQYASQIAGGQYLRGGPPGPSGTDCSGAQAWITNFLTGGSGRFSTGNEAEALASRGFQMGDPPPGVAAYWVGWKNGGPGGGHTAGTILDPSGGNVNVEMGGASGGGAFGGGAAGAAGFPNRAWIQIAGGEDPNVGPGSFSSPDSPATGGGVSSGGGGGSGGGGFDGKSLGQLIGAGVKESVSIPGFMDPFDTPNAKSVMALANFGLGLLGGGGDGGFGGDLLGGVLGGAGINLPNLSTALSPKGPQATTPISDPNTTQHGQGNGAAPGPTFNVTANGMDPKAVVDKQAHAFNQAYRGSGLPAVRP